MPHFAPEACHQHLFAQAPLSLSYANNHHRDFGEWRADIATTLRRLLGPTPEMVPLNIEREPLQQHEEFREIRFTFTSEAMADVPCHLLLPNDGETPYLVVICLQGHTSGMHLSLGRAKSEADVAMLSGGRDFGLQAVRQGYAALVLEQRCFGERRDSRIPDKAMGCAHASMAALLLGRTMIGERCWDVSRAIDALAEFPEIDSARIACMGNSGGGTITYFAACLDERIKAAMPSCYVCTFRASIGSIDHCADNYIPGILNYFEMGDLAVLLAPRPLVVVAGRHDEIFPIAAVEETFSTIHDIYQAQGAETACRLIIGDEGHRFYPDRAWPAFRELTGW